MPTPRDFIFGPWRAVSVLGVTEILAWGALFYPPVLTVPLIAADHGWSTSFAMGGFSLGLFVGGLVSRYVGATIDKLGGHVVMPAGSLIGAIGLVGLVMAQSAVAYFSVWMVIGVAMAAGLYDPAFATLGRIFGAAARAPITTLTLAGGFASTVSWPATRFLIDAVGWRGTYLVYAALLAFVAAPLHAFALPRQHAERAALAKPATEVKPAPFLPAHGLAFVLVAAGFAVLRLCAIGAIGAASCHFPKVRADAGHRGRDRHVVRPGASTRPHLRAHFRAPAASVVDRAIRSRPSGRGLYCVGAVAVLGGGRRGIRHDVRLGERPSDHRARHGAAGAVRPVGLRASGRVVSAARFCWCNRSHRWR